MDEHPFIELIEKHDKTLIFIWAEYCQASKNMFEANIKPYLEGLANNNVGIVIISPIWRFSRLRNPSSRTKTTGQLLAFGGGHLIWIWSNAYPAQVEAVGIETGVDGGIAGAVGGGVEIACGLEEVELLVSQVLQEGFP